MNVVIVYDSIFGNTARIAEAMADALRPTSKVTVCPVHSAKTLDLADVDLLIVGSPTRGFCPTPQISEWVAGLKNRPAPTSAATFDTRLALETVEAAPLRWVINLGGYANTRLATALSQLGIAVRGVPAGFFVLGAKGPLKEGEIARAQAWAAALLPAKAVPVPA